MNVRILDVENETIIEAVLLSKHTVFSSDIGIVAFIEGSLNNKFGAVLLQYGLILKDTISDSMQNSFASFLLKQPFIKHWSIIGAENGAANFCEKLNIEYPLNPDFA